MGDLRFTWDPRKAASEEDRFILLGLSAALRLLVVIHCYRVEGGTSCPTSHSAESAMLRSLGVPNALGLARTWRRVVYWPALIGLAGSLLDCTTGAGPAVRIQPGALTDTTGAVFEESDRRPASDTRQLPEARLPS